MSLKIAVAQGPIVQHLKQLQCWIVSPTPLAMDICTQTGVVPILEFSVALMASLCMCGLVAINNNMLDFNTDQQGETSQAKYM